jgi:hypothetical protein
MNSTSTVNGVVTTSTNDIDTNNSPPSNTKWYTCLVFGYLFMAITIVAPSIYLGKSLHKNIKQ